MHLEQILKNLPLGVGTPYQKTGLKRVTIQNFLQPWWRLSKRIGLKELDLEHLRESQFKIYFNLGEDYHLRIGQKELDIKALYSEWSIKFSLKMNWICETFYWWVRHKLFHENFSWTGLDMTIYM